MFVTAKTKLTNLRNMKKSIAILGFILLASLFGSKANAQSSDVPSWAKETKEEKAKRMAWWQNDRFGLFIHWGLYSLPARHEWIQKNESISQEDYYKYFELFNPDLYNPKEWAAKAKAAGMKYVVLTTKHHDGFCLWDSKYTDYKVTNTPYGKDLLKPFIDAFKAEGIKVGLYYSLLDWHHPHYTYDQNHPDTPKVNWKEENKKRDMNIYRQYMKDQLTELLTEYGEIDELFLDFSFPEKDGVPGKGRDDWKSEELLKHVRSLAPNIIVDNRLDLNDTSWGWDYVTPEQFMPSSWPLFRGEKTYWETCQTFSGSWGYHRDENSWKSPRQLLVMLIESVSKGGNLLLNVGPTGRGEFDERANDRLEAFADWMKYHDKSIYGCTEAPADYAKPNNCLLTYNPETNRLYIHVLEWPFKSLHLKGYKGKFKYAQLLNDNSEIKYASPRVTMHGDPGGGNMGEFGAPDDIFLSIPTQKPNVEIPVIELILD